MRALSGNLGITVDTLAPSQPAIMDLRTSSDSGLSASDNITNDNTPTFDFSSTDTYHRIRAQRYADQWRL